MKIKITDQKLSELVLLQNQFSSPTAPRQRAPVAQEVKQMATDPVMGQFLQRHMFSDEVSIAMLCWHLDQDLELLTGKMSESVSMNFMLSGSIHSEFETLQHSIRLAPMQHNLLYNTDSTGIHLFPAGTTLQSLNVAFSPDYFKRICTAESPTTEMLLNNMDRKSPKLASLCNGHISCLMEQTIRSLLVCPFKGAMKKLYLEAKVLELLALQLHSLEQQLQHRTAPPSAEATLAEEVKLYLEAHYLELNSLQQLARHFATNEFKLKKVFRERFGGGIFAYAQQLRLEHARELLLAGGKSISEVAELIGYSHANHFSNAFRKRYGIPPSQVCKKAQVSAVNTRLKV